MDPPRPAPYPANTLAKGWRFELDYDQIERSSTWAIAGQEGQAWLLKMWFKAWSQRPCASLPSDEEVIAGLLGMAPEQWAQHRRALLRGWRLADDGRLYHDTMSKLVVAMMDRRRSESDRQARFRLSGPRNVTRDMDVTTPDVTRDNSVTAPVVTPESTRSTALSTDQVPDTNKTNTKSARKRAAPAALVSADDMVQAGVDRQHALDWLVTRKTKSLPLTPTAWGKVIGEAEKAGIPIAKAIEVAAQQGWGGFRGSWLASIDAPKGVVASQPSATVPGTDSRADRFLAEQDQRAELATPPPARILALARRAAGQ